ncbi:hypothetical protein [Galbibacter orientalis]|uniref:ComEC/Rec2 family competence protein n=1 Tax=Galbibacter orientalis TaxID=453852 RepID=UPI003080E63D
MQTTIKLALYFLFILCFYKGISQETYPNWEPGILEIHHINTGRGDATFCVFPDGTTLLIDAGDTSETHPRTLSDRNAKLLPNRSKTAPEWIVDYINQFHPKPKGQTLDYALITHYHDDHFGEVDSTRLYSKKGKYQLTGIVAVGDAIPIKNLIDRGSQFPIDLKDEQVQKELSADKYHIIPTLKNYWKYSDVHSKNGLKHSVLKAGMLNQIRLLYNPENYKSFSVRNIAVNGNVWTGEKENYYALFSEGDSPSENNLSTVIKISFGLFDYYTGGDISGVNAIGATDFNSLESNIAPVVGPVDVATLNHHGNRDSQNAFYVRTLRPRVWVQQNWSSDHPGEEVLRRILSKEIYPGERDVFSTVMLAANKKVIGNRLDAYKSQEGHIVVRVYNDGKKYNVYILNDKDEKRNVVNKFGPYEAR